MRLGGQVRAAPAVLASSGWLRQIGERISPEASRRGRASDRGYQRCVERRSDDPWNVALPTQILGGEPQDRDPPRPYQGVLTMTIRQQRPGTLVHGSAIDLDDQPPAAGELPAQVSTPDERPMIVVQRDLQIGWWKSRVSALQPSPGFELGLRKPVCLVAPVSKST